MLFQKALRLSTKGTPTVNVHKSLTRFFFDDVGAKKKLGKKENAARRFHRLRAATRAPRPRPRRLPKTAGENFNQIDESPYFGL